MGLAKIAQGLSLSGWGVLNFPVLLTLYWIASTGVVAPERDIAGFSFAILGFIACRELIRKPPPNLLYGLGKTALIGSLASFDWTVALFALNPLIAKVTRVDPMWDWPYQARFFVFAPAVNSVLFPIAYVLQWYCSDAGAAWRTEHARARQAEQARREAELAARLLEEAERKQQQERERQARSAELALHKKERRPYPGFRAGAAVGLLLGIAIMLLFTGRQAPQRRNNGFYYRPAYFDTGPITPLRQFLEVAQRLRAFPPNKVFLSMSWDVSSAEGVVDSFSDDIRRYLWRGQGPTPGAAEYEALLQADYPLPVLLSFLGDPNPKIRTLAAAAIVAKGDPRLQWNFAPLVDDESRTFDQITAPMSAGPVHLSYVPQTVATATLRLAEKRSAADFDRYWASHGNRQYCADWFLWQFRHGFASAARAQIRGVPSPDRELITLWIGKQADRFRNPNAPAPPFSEEELVAAAKSLGSQRVIAVLRNEPPTTDPDILDNTTFGTNHDHYYQMGLFLLSHARNVLEARDADTLLDLETAERNWKDSPLPAYREWWPIAAASLRPDRADAILNAAETRWPDAGRVQLARWDENPAASVPKIVRWFYRSRETERSLAAAIYDADRNTRYEPLVKAILSSNGRLTIDGEAMYRFATVVQEWKTTQFKRYFVDWVYAQPPEQRRENIRPRELVLQVAGIARQLVRDSRFNKADAQLLCYIEQSLNGNLKLSHAESVRLYQLIVSIGRKGPKNTPQSDCAEIRRLMRKGMGI